MNTAIILNLIVFGMSIGGMLTFYFAYKGEVAFAIVAAGATQILGNVLWKIIRKEIRKEMKNFIKEVILYIFNK
ncbi:MAG: hypothetical protein JZD41_02095 [Thermoproteus sp.]|nr:hypothetical protein [Thermoproteus sp.]